MFLFFSELTQLTGIARAGLGVSQNVSCFRWFYSDTKGHNPFCVPPFEKHAFLHEQQATCVIIYCGKVERGVARLKPVSLEGTQTIACSSHRFGFTFCVQEPS